MRILLAVLFSLLLMPSCVHRPTVEVRSLLEEAEGMIRTSPDTAYFLLREMETTMDLETEADSAYHGLLLLEAQTKNGMKLTDTTRLQSLIHYYQEQQDSLMQVRLLRLRAVAYRDGGHYNEAVRCYNATIDKAKRIDEKRWLADMYQELAHLHYSGFLILGADSCKLLSDSLFTLTIQKAKELGDSVLWMKSLIAPIVVTKQQKNMEAYEQQLLQALDLAVALEDSTTGANVSMYLSVLYGEKGIKEKVLPYVKRSLSLRGKKSSEAVFCIALGNAFQQIGMKDSADYYLERGKELRKKEELAMYSNLSELSSSKTAVSTLKMYVERLRQKEVSRKHQSYRSSMVVSVLIVALVVVIVFAIYRGKKYSDRHQEEENLRKTSEKLSATLEGLKKQLVEEVLSVKIQLQQKETELCRQREVLQAEREVLACKEQEIKSLRLRLDNLSSDTTLCVFDKIKQIISDFSQKNYSTLKMEEADWLQLQELMDKQWNGAISRIQEKYQLLDVEIRLFCLNLTDIPTVHISFLFDRKRDYAYVKTRELFVKLGIERGKDTYRKVLEKFIEKQG